MTLVIVFQRLVDEIPAQNAREASGLLAQAKVDSSVHDVVIKYTCPALRRLTCYILPATTTVTTRTLIITARSARVVSN